MLWFWVGRNELRFPARMLHNKSEGPGVCSSVGDIGGPNMCSDTTAPSEMLHSSLREPPTHATVSGWTK